ncbi:hypothetical protein [Budvicia aquatica]|uniref:hypothetical protein n=1 Tax=Budvicia aquatica TaxID=82979 RepID=UPI0026EFBA8F|nr:hypothetical protein [Budvicia aquatica]
MRLKRGTEGAMMAPVFDAGCRADDKPGVSHGPTAWLTRHQIDAVTATLMPGVKMGS